MAAFEALAAGLIGISMWAAQVHPPAASPDIFDFQKRVARYLKIRKDAASAVDTLKATDSPEKIQGHQRDLAISIRAARPDAAQGNIFTPTVTAEFRRIIEGALRAPGAERVKKGMRDTQPSPLPPIAVNGTYPVQDPVQSMPPSLLKRLPPLPRELEYRVVGHTLILRDIDANLIVDYISEAVR